MRPRQVFDLFKRAANAWLDDYAPSMGAALSYYTVFSIAPLLLVVIAVAGMFFGREAAQSRILEQLADLVGGDTAAAIAQMLRSGEVQGNSPWAAALGLITMLIGATTVLGELQTALDRIWRSRSAATSGLWSVIRERLLSFGMILGLVFLLLVSTVVSAAIAAFNHWGSSALGEWKILLEGVNLAIGFGVTTLLFAMIYKLLPREHIAWSDVWVGALVTAALFTIGKFLIGLYIGKSGVASAYGAAGSLVVLLIWVYYSAQIFLLGAEFTWVYTYTHGSRAGQKPPDATTTSQKTIDVETTVPSARHAPSTGR